MRKTASQIFASEEADNYFARNGFKRGMIADYILSLLPHQQLMEYDVAEFGIGGGQNLMLLKNYARSVHGFDASEKAISCFRAFYEHRPDAKDFSSTLVNVCEPFTSSQVFDLIIYGFFAYYAEDAELDIVKANALNALQPGGYLFVYDFLSRNGSVRQDSRNPSLMVHKRTLPFWIAHLREFDLIDFRLFDSQKGAQERMRSDFSTVDPDIPHDDMLWTFGALFRRKL
jgi:hypothetical protein